VYTAGDRSQTLHDHDATGGNPKPERRARTTTTPNRQRPTTVTDFVEPMTVRRLTLALDPGENTGVAWGIDGKLVACSLAHPGDLLSVPEGPARELVFFRDAHCVIELPRLYPVGVYGSPRKATAIGNSLIREAVTLGGFKDQALRLGMSTEEILPRDWKGMVAKRTMCKRVIDRMTRDERRLVVALGLPKSKVHNVLDAIGIFFWKVGRL
jgi:hypothetical protein